MEFAHHLHVAEQSTLQERTDLVLWMPWPWTAFFFVARLSSLPMVMVFAAAVSREFWSELSQAKQPAKSPPRRRGQAGPGKAAEKASNRSTAAPEETMARRIAKVGYLPTHPQTDRQTEPDESPSCCLPAEEELRSEIPASRVLSLRTAASPQTPTDLAGFVFACSIGNQVRKSFPGLPADQATALDDNTRPRLGR